MTQNFSERMAAMAPPTMAFFAGETAEFAIECFMTLFALPPLLALIIGVVSVVKPITLMVGAARFLCRLDPALNTGFPSTKPGKLCRARTDTPLLAPIFRYA